MNVYQKIGMMESNIKKAIEDYFKHTFQNSLEEKISYNFIRRLAIDNFDAKTELRELFRKSPVWNEDLDALVINGSRTHDPDYNRIYYLTHRILDGPLNNGEYCYDDVRMAISYFSDPTDDEVEIEERISAINRLAPHAYHPGKKPARIFRALCDALGVNSSTFEDFGRCYANLADEISSRKIDFKLFVSINPAHFLTMSNPKGDVRGDSLTSCHSLNSKYRYNNGCSGYARDAYTFIAFTVADPDDAESLNNRKNMRQIFCYKPGNGVLLQSRLYNDAGGVNREVSESKIYRDLIQREISALEDMPNLWKTYRYYDRSPIVLNPSENFGGYADWTYEDFGAKISIREDRMCDFESFEIGNSGLCIKCGDDTEVGLFCDHCCPKCDVCGSYLEDGDEYIVYRNGEEITVCESCRDDYYTYCDFCNRYVYDGEIITTLDGDRVCSDCLNIYYVQCDRCGEYIREDDAIKRDDIYLCKRCSKEEDDI